MEKIELEELKRVPLYNFNHSETEEERLRKKIYFLEIEVDALKRKQVKLPERYIINENACILFWKNGEKTVVKRCADDAFNPRLAFLTAFFQLSKNKANKYLANLQVEVKEEEQKQEPKHTEEKIDFKVGDMVKVTKSDEYSKKGWKGEITHIDTAEVKINYTNGQSWWILKDNIKLIKEEK